MSGILQTAGRMMTKSGLAFLFTIFGLFSLLAPFLFGEQSIPISGFLLMVTGILQVFYAFRRVSEMEQRTQSGRGKLMLFAGLVIFAVPSMVSRAVILAIVILLVFFSLQGLLAGIRSWKQGRSEIYGFLEPIFSLGLAIILYSASSLSASLIIGIVSAYWQFSTAVSMASIKSRDLLNASAEQLPLPDHPGLKTLARSLAEEQKQRISIDRSWIKVFLLVLFAIHAGRMQIDWDLVGMLSPLVAVLGDSAMALLIAYIFIFPARFGFQKLTRPLETRLWNWRSGMPPDKAFTRVLKKTIEYLLKRRLIFVIRMKQARYSVRGLLDRGLQTGLPIVAIIAATTPIWGMSWYFDTENWAAGIWNSWAENRTETWRAAMVESVRKEFPERGGFLVNPGLDRDTTDFSFIVIGDTGEGDASQLVLKHQLTLLGHESRIKFLVLSSDVIYPSGEMKDYETKFFLPFMGFPKPIYAIPGNHDWYDSLEGFSATFFRPDSARASMKARIEVDRKITTTREQQINSYIQTAQRLSSQYDIRAGLQDAPYFKYQNDQFSLIAVDTGVAKRVDSDQLNWFENSLQQAGKRFKMVVLGHPLYAGGIYQAESNPDFASIHELIRRYHVDLVMAGDTHDLEYYREDPPESGPIHHFVNGGGGAYLSFGTALGWPGKPATSNWAFYPSRAAVVGKLDQLTPLWKRPFWLWTKHFEAWPFSAEALSALFDYNSAPFFQSFTEISVEPSKGRVRVLPYGIHGRLQWGDFQHSENFGQFQKESLAEFVIPFPANR